MFGWLRKTFGWLRKTFGLNLGKRFEESGIRSSAARIKESIDELETVFGALQDRRKKNTEDVDGVLAMKADFDLVLSKWQLEEHERLPVASAMQKEANVYAFLSLWAAVYLLTTLGKSSLLVNAVVFAVMLALGFMCTARKWRSSCLSSREFKPFKEWVSDGFRF